MPESEIWSLTPEQNVRLDALAKKTRAKKSELLNRAVDEFLDRRIPRPKSAEQIANERDAEIMQMIRAAAREHGVRSADVRNDIRTLNPKQLESRYHFAPEIVKELQEFATRYK